MERLHTLLIFCIGCMGPCCWSLLDTHYRETSVEGEDVELNCTLPAGSHVFAYVKWKKGNTTLFDNRRDSSQNRNEVHELHSFFSIFKIRNVSLDDEGTYKSEIQTLFDYQKCYITLTVYVRPGKLILLGNDTNEMIHDSLHAVDGTSRAIRCQTDTAVKPTINLEWIIPEGLHIVEETVEVFEDEHDRRLAVPSTTLSFIVTNDDHGKIVKCIVNKTFDSSDLLQTFVYLHTIEILSSTSPAPTEEVQTVVPTSSEASDTSLTTENIGLYNDTTLKIGLCSAGVAVSIVIAVIIIKLILLRKTKKQDRKRTPTADVRTVAMTPVDQLDEDSPPVRGQTLMPEPRPVHTPCPRAPTQTLVPLSDQALLEPTRANRENFEAFEGSNSYPREITRNEGPLDPTVVYATVDKRNKTKGKNIEYGKEGDVDLTDISALYATVNKKRDTSRNQNFNKELHVEMNNQFRSKSQTDDAVQHIHKHTTTGMVEYAVVTKTKTRCGEGQAQVAHSKAPNNPEIEYAEIDLTKKNRRYHGPRRN